MKNDPNNTVDGTLYQEISQLKSQVFEKTFECEMLKIRLRSQEEQTELWHKLYKDAVSMWVQPSPEYTNDMMRC